VDSIQSQIETLRNSKESIRNIEQKIQDNPNLVQLHLNLEFLPGMIGYEPHRQTLHVWSEENPEGIDVNPPSDLTLPEFELYIKNKLGLDRSQEISLALSLVDEVTNELIPVRIGEKIGVLDIDEQTTIGEIFGEMSGYSLTIMPLTAGAWGGTSDSYWIYTPFKEVSPTGVVIDRKSEKVFNFRRKLLPLTSSNYKIADNILLKASDSEIEAFSDEFDSQVVQLMKEVFNIKSSEVTFEDKKAFVLSQLKDIFEDAYLYNEKKLGRALTSRELEWNTRMTKFWKDSFVKKVDKASVVLIDSILTASFESSVLLQLFEISKTFELKKSSEVFTKLSNSLYNRKLFTDNQFRNEIRNNFLNEFFATFFAQRNFNEFKTPLASFAERTGALAELQVFIKFLPNALRHTYENNEIDAASISKIIDKYYFGYGKKLFSEPYFSDGVDNWRYPDLSNWLFLANQMKDAIIRIQPIKFVSDPWTMKHILADLLSSMYIQVRYNMFETFEKKGLQIKNLQIEAALISLIQNNDGLNNFDGYFSFVLNELSGLDFYSLFGRNKEYKGSNRILQEEKIIEAVNKKIWEKLGYQPSYTDYQAELKKLVSDVGFILNEIISKHKVDKIFSSSDLSDIQDFIRDISNLKASEFKSQFSEFEYIDEDSGNIFEVSGIDRASNFNYYRITDIKLEGIIESVQGGYQIGDEHFKEVYILKSNKLTPITSLNEIKDKSFRIIHSKEGDLALAEISHNKLVKTPNDWYDGIILNGKLIRNAIISDYSGYLLSSIFYNAKENKFSLKNVKEFNNEFLEGKIGDNDFKYGIRILFSFAKSDSNGYLHSLLLTNLINPAFAPQTSELYHSFPSQMSRNYFENLEDLYEFKSAKSQLTEDGTFELISAEKDTSIISKEDLFSVFLDLFEFKNLLIKESSHTSKEQSISLLIRKFLGALNLQYDPFSGEIDPTSIREISDVELIFSELFKEGNKLDDQAVQNFLFLKENEDGKFVPVEKEHFDSGEFTFKKWLKDIFVRVKDYSGSNKHILEAQKLLEKYSKNIINTNSDPKYFDKQNGELQAGKAIFESINRLFGHITLMFVFTHMIDFYQYKRGYKLDILTAPSREALLDSVRKLGIKTLIKTTQIDTPLGRKVILNNLFSLFFLDSYMHLPVSGDIESSTNMVSFGYSPMPFIEGSLKTNSLKEFHVEIQDQFYFQYYSHFSELYAGSGTKNVIRNLFYESGKEIMSVVEKKIRAFIDSMDFNSIKYKQSFKDSLYNRLVLATEREIFDMLNYRFTDGSYNIRFQIENLLTGINEEDLATDTSKYFNYNKEENTHERDIIFHTVLVNGEPFILRFSKSDFEGKDIRIWRSAIRHHEGSKVTDFRQADVDFSVFNKGAIDDKVQVLREIIEKNSGKVKIYLAPNVGEKLIDGKTLSYGYQYAYSTLKKILPPTTIASEARYIVIDLSKDSKGNYIDSLTKMKLQYVVALSMAYAPSQSNRKNTMDFMFIMKQYSEDITYEYEKAICIFDRNKFYKLNEIYSVRQSDRLYKQITLTGFEDSLIWKTKWENDWSKNNRYMLVNYEQIFNIYGFLPWW